MSSMLIFCCRCSLYYITFRRKFVQNWGLLVLFFGAMIVMLFTS